MSTPPWVEMWVAPVPGPVKSDPVNSEDDEEVVPKRVVKPASGPLDV